jgi:lipid-binding SYLF domain-containing protein
MPGKGPRKERGSFSLVAQATGRNADVSDCPLIPWETIVDRYLSSGLLFLLILFTGATAAGWDPDKTAEARQAIAAFKKADPSLKRFFNAAHAYAVFPTVGKGGFGIGGAYGRGLVFKGGQVVGKTSLTQLTIGFQLGGQAYREIIFFEDRPTFDDFKQGNFELSAQASAVAATFGASADADFDNGVAVFTLAKGGLMYEASIGGQKFSYDQ